MKQLLFFAIALAILFGVVACTGSQYATKAPDSVLREAPKTTGSASLEKPRMVLFSAALDLVVADADTAAAALVRIAERYNGYAAEIGTTRTIIRVESARLNEVIQDIAQLGKLQRKNLQGQDVTDEYLDYEIRLENATKARDRYLELLAKAENVEAALKVERELERLNETIDLLKGRMNRIEHLAAFSTITVNLQERKKPGVLGYLGLGLYHSVKWLLVRN
ncbi:MAG TPA: DUF4349 domain-containing protein [Saprospiraceae bacterium]|nr:DUF4349 domain-containing protein [Saprospiraceae bacterium]HMP23216.1 DUF4349 domain-containing protein [Saprospiraceae bacterium]